MVISSLGGTLKIKPKYEYAATRAHIRGSWLLTDDDYSRMLKMSTEEIIKMLEEGQYMEEIDKIGLKIPKIDLIERVLNLNLAKTLSFILKIAPLGSQLGEYLRKYDVYNIKTILRGKTAEIPKESIKKNLIYTGLLRKEFLDKLVDSETVLNVIESFKGSVYYTSLKSNENKGIDKMEDALDRMYYNRMIMIGASDSGLLELIKVEIDLKNIVNLIRLKRSGIKNIEDFLIPKGNIGTTTLKSLYTLNEFEIIEKLSSKKMWTYTDKGTKELDKIEAGLRKYHLLLGTALLKTYYPSLRVLLGYVVAKEREIANIRMMIQYKEIKNPEEAIRLKAKLYVK